MHVVVTDKFAVTILNYVKTFSQR